MTDIGGFPFAGGKGYDDGLTSPSEMFSKLYPALDDMGDAVTAEDARGFNRMGGGYGETQASQNPNDIPGLGPEQVDPYDLD